MKTVVKWVAMIVAGLGMISFLFLFQVYQDFKSTAEEVYTPIQDGVSEKRGEAVDVASKDPFSVLILGVDEREGDSGRSDTIIVLTVNPTLKTTKMLSIPRDTYTAIIGMDIKDKINHAYAFGGIEMSMKTVENFLDIPIDYVAQVNMESFIDIVDIVDGISVDNTFDFYYEGEHFPIGELELDGETALKYVRMRYEDPAGDFGRQNRQKQVIQGVLKEVISLNTAWNYQAIFQALEKNVQINIMFEELLDMRKNYASSLKNIEQLYLTNGSGTMMNGIYYYMPNEAELETIQGLLQEHLEL
ncbi:LCP family protein [Lysinibacillus sp. KU-BSD001]|uniref:LCP family glycopolymer transferase n=1 Tax=Lysinibacillus sp. KU-BSD001 TaxID=3141328 RepID=UPI0036E7D466